MLSPDFLDRIRHRIGSDRLLTDPADCWPYGYDNSRQHQLPDAVAFATSHDEVRDIVRLCNEHRVPRSFSSLRGLISIVTFMDLPPGVVALRDENRHNRTKLFREN